MYSEDNNKLRGKIITGSIYETGRLRKKFHEKMIDENVFDSEYTCPPQPSDPREVQRVAYWLEEKSCLKVRTRVQDIFHMILTTEKVLF